MIWKILFFFINNVTEHGILGIFINLIIISLIYYSIPAIMAIFQDDDKKKQKHGDDYETTVAGMIEKKFKVKPLRNVLLTSANDETELDMVFITGKGIFAVECKYHDSEFNPRLLGGMADPEWTVANECEMLNPFIQNEKHIRFLEEKLDKNPIYNIVYTSAPFTLKFFGKERNSEDEPAVSLLGTEKRAIVYDKKGFTHKGTEALATAIDNLPDVFDDTTVAQLTAQVSQWQMNKKQRKAFAERMKNRAAQFEQ